MSALGLNGNGNQHWPSLNVRSGQIHSVMTISAHALQFVSQVGKKV